MATKTWYDRGYEDIISDLAAIAHLTPEQARAAYGFLFNEGFIDYDVAKELFWNRNEERYGNGD